MLTITCNIVLLAAALLLVIVVTADAAEIRDKRNIESQYNNLKGKRPFCNAFTGCGRKRSAGPIVEGGGGKGGGGRAEYNSIPAGFSADSRAELDELARHVLAQARLWEQLQHKVELLKSVASGYPDPSGNSLETLPYRRRKRAVHQSSSPQNQDNNKDQTQDNHHKRASEDKMISQEQNENDDNINGDNQEEITSS